jgi:hypothetical protein
MTRSPSYWVWLLADLSLNRAIALLTHLNFPKVNTESLSKALGEAYPWLSPDLENHQAFAEALRLGLSRHLGSDAEPVKQWLSAFPFSSDSDAPALYYWDNRFSDFLYFDPVPAPKGIDKSLWSAFTAAYQGKPPCVSEPWSLDLQIAATIMTKHRDFLKELDRARAAPLTEKDRELYLRFGWNEEGSRNGLAALEIGARFRALQAFWLHCNRHIPEMPLIELAAQKDLESWERVSNPNSFTNEAIKLGTSPQELAETMFPKPPPPPKLSEMVRQAQSNVYD